MDNRVFRLTEIYYCFYTTILRCVFHILLCVQMWLLVEFMSKNASQSRHTAHLHPHIPNNADINHRLLFVSLYFEYTNIRRSIAVYCKQLPNKMLCECVAYNMIYSDWLQSIELWFNLSQLLLSPTIESLAKVVSRMKLFFLC